MSDENYSLVLLQIICLLMFFCGVVALTQHPEWFDAPNKAATSQNYSPESAVPQLVALVGADVCSRVHHDAACSSKDQGEVTSRRRRIAISGYMLGERGQ